jgi:hypothetical protein
MAVDGLAAILAFFGVDPKKLPRVCSARSVPTRPFGLSCPAPLPQAARGEGLSRVRGNAELHLLPPYPLPLWDFFWVDPKKGALF